MPKVCVPLFPLPGLVLFPRTFLPLHIFEPRYVQMVGDVLVGDRKMAVGNLRPGWEDDYFGAPPAHRTITIARLLNEERLPGGKFNILLEGVERATVVEEVQTEPYRIVRAEPMVDVLLPERRADVQSAMRDVVELAERLGGVRRPLRAALTNLENTLLHPGIIADHVAALVVKDPYERQSLLEERDVLRRLRLVAVQVRIALADAIESVAEDSGSEGGEERG